MEQLTSSTPDQVTINCRSIALYQSWAILMATVRSSQGHRINVSDGRMRTFGREKNTAMNKQKQPQVPLSKIPDFKFIPPAPPPKHRHSSVPHYRIYWRHLPQYNELVAIFDPLNFAARVHRAIHSQVGNYSNALLSGNAK